jgi:hypothetical protein
VQEGGLYLPARDAGIARHDLPPVSPAAPLMEETERLLTTEIKRYAPEQPEATPRRAPTVAPGRADEGLI